MPLIQPHGIEINVKDTDNSTTVEGAKILIRNTNKKSSLFLDADDVQIVTDSSGVALVDLANLPLIGGQTNVYDQGDKVLIIAYDGVNHAASLYTVIEDEHTLTLTMNPSNFDPNITVGKLQGIVAANTTSSVYEVKVYAVADGELLCQLECPANNTITHTFGGERGKSAAGGFVIERENSGVVVTTTFR